MNKLQRFDRKMVLAGLTPKQRIAVVSALNEYLDEKRHEEDLTLNRRGVLNKS